MNYFNKNRLLLWAVIFFLVINVSALATFFIYFNSAGKQVSPVASGQSCGQFCRVLDLTGEQSAEAEAIRAAFREKADPLVGQIKENRRLMLEELSRDIPDTLLVNRYADSIGELQKHLQKTAAAQFLALKKVCTPGQCMKLTELYFNLYGCKGADEMMNRGKGKQHRYHGGK